MLDRRISPNPFAEVECYNSMCMDAGKPGCCKDCTPDDRGVNLEAK